MSTSKKEQKSKKVIMVRIYQGVTFDGKMESSFITDGTPTRKAVEVEIVDLGIEVYNERDYILVPWANIAGIHFESAKYKAKKAAEKSEAVKAKVIATNKVDTATRPR